jgi:hypothetical protein
MPWYVTKSKKCPVGKPYAVLKKDTGELVPGGCHSFKGQAVDHMRALYANEKKMSESENGINS